MRDGDTDGRCYDQNPDAALLDRPGAETAAYWQWQRAGFSSGEDASNAVSRSYAHSCAAPVGVVGAAATRLYMPERATNDLDVLIRSQDSVEARAKLTQTGATFKSKYSIGGSSWLLLDGFPADVIECSEGWAEAALAEAQANRGAQGMPILPLPYLALMKFEASRVQYLADITRMLGQASEERLNAVRAVFQQWLPDEAQDLESLITLGKLEMQ